MIYLDYAATTPMCREAIQVYDEVAKSYFGNAESLHDYGSTARSLADKARREIAFFIGAEERGLFFTGSGSEANQLAILSLARGNKNRGKHLITTRAEHSCVRNTFGILENEGFEIEYVPVDEKGRVHTGQLESILRSDTLLVSIQHVNSEIGTIQNLNKIGRLLNEKGILFHSDCVQSFGKIPLNASEAHLHSISISAHKIYGPKGVGAAFIKPKVQWKPDVPGTTHERGFRPGTLNTPGIMAFLAAAQRMENHRQSEWEHLHRLKQQFIQGLEALPFEIALEGDVENGMANIIGFRIVGMEGQYAMLECNRQGLAISTGSACSVGTEKPAASMTALNRDEQSAREFVRVSFGKDTQKEDIDQALQIFEKVLTHHFKMVKQ